VSSSATETPAAATSLPSMSASDASNAPTVFTPVSVSAVSVDDWWVLGYSMTTYADGVSGGGATILHTTDGGQHFAETGSPGVLVAQAPLPRPAGAATVSDVRFGSADDGWAYGDALYATTDGGASWSAVDGIGGGVVDLAAANGVAWAVVDLGAFVGPTPPPSVAPDARYAIYSTPYGKVTQHWTRVSMPFDLGATTPSIVDQDGTVTLLASGPARAGDHDHVLIAPAGKPFTDYVGPCYQDLGGDLSNSKAAIWASCPTGTMAAVSVSTDRGATWQPVHNLELAAQGAHGLGAIDDHSAIVFDVAVNGLSRLSATGQRQTVASSAENGLAGATFIGFTDADTGFAIVSTQDGASELLRTTDGGTSWFSVDATP
jgi:hypothetical protein